MSPSRLRLGTRAATDSRDDGLERRAAFHEAYHSG
jgi:hypothetical protein